jgi:iron complex outermembrane recepter protein
VSVFDPVAGLNIPQSDAKTKVYGAELEAGINPLTNLTIFGSASYNQSEILNDFRTALNTFIRAKGNQTPDTPKVLAKLGLTYRPYKFEISPIVQYVGPRYGDALNNERIPSYWLVDLYLNYKLPTFLGLKDVTAGLSVLNLFNEGYISTITASDNAATGTYGVGAPRTFAATFRAQF